MSISYAKARQNGAGMIILEIALADYAKTAGLQDQAIAVCWIEIPLQKHIPKLHGSFGSKRPSLCQTEKNSVRAYVFRFAHRVPTRGRGGLASS
jgi:hypothetical protein